MALGIGIALTDRIVAGLVQGSELVGNLLSGLNDNGEPDDLHGLPADMIAARIAQHLSKLKQDEKPTYIGLAMPGIVRNNVVEDSPNLAQFKGVQMGVLLENHLRPLFGDISLTISNDATSMAAALAASRGQLDRLTRLWFLGEGIGFGRYPEHDGVWEAGHSVVTLDPKETFCGCGGRGHLEGIMGYRAMRLRFMDLEPEEVFEHAKNGEERCVEFVKLWHRALAAATATSIHTSGVGRFYITGPNAKFLNLALYKEYVHDMVQLSPLQSYSIEVVNGGESLAVVGAAVIAARSAGLHD